MNQTFLMDMIIADAYLKGVTDILFDPSAVPETSNVLFRMDGVMQEYMAIPCAVANDIMKILKGIANLDDEVNHLPKIGRILFKHKGLPEFHLMVTICTTANLREKAILKIRTD